jgi:hypothetical protein
MKLLGSSRLEPRDICFMVTEMEKVRTVIPASAISLLLAGCAVSARPHSSQPPRLTSLCELAASGSRSHGKIVRLRAIFITDLMHGSVLKDRSCPQVTFKISYAVGPASDASINGFDHAVDGNPNDMSLRVFEIDMVGRSSWRRSEKPPGRIYVSSITSYAPTTY